MYAILIIMSTAKLVQFSVVDRDTVFLQDIGPISWNLACRSPSIYRTLCYLQFGYLQHKCIPLTNLVLFFIYLIYLFSYYAEAAHVMQLYTTRQLDDVKS